MEIVITDWALQSYLNLKHCFTDSDYENILRPDAELLKIYPNHPRFNNYKFWGPCKEKSGKIIHGSYKMKWHNIGPGGVQLRLLIAILENRAYLCNAYVKDNVSTDFREMAKMKVKVQLINAGQYTFLGRLL